MDKCKCCEKRRSGGKCRRCREKCPDACLEKICSQQEKIDDLDSQVQTQMQEIDKLDAQVQALINAPTPFPPANLAPQKVIKNAIAQFIDPGSGGYPPDPGSINCAIAFLITFCGARLAGGNGVGALINACT